VGAVAARAYAPGPMRRLAPLFVLLGLAPACSEPVSGTLRIGPVDEGRAFEVVFEPATGSLDPGVVHLEFQVVGAKLVLQGTAAGTGGCLPLPASRRMVVLTGEDGLPPGARIRVAAWQYEAPSASRTANGQTSTPAPGSRCSGILVADAIYTVPGEPDAGVVDAGVPDGGGPEGGVDAGAPDGGAPDAAGPDGGGLDASGLDAELPDTGTSTRSDAGA
jgi:hypothetical protein